MVKSSERAQEKLHSLNISLENQDLHQVQRILNTRLAPADIAHTLETSPPKIRTQLWKLIDDENKGEVLQFLSEDISGFFLRNISAQEAIRLTSELDTDNIADILQQLPASVSNEVLQTMDDNDRLELESVLAYPEDSAGGLMNTDTVTIRPDVCLQVVLRYLRLYPSLPNTTDKLLVVNRNKEFIGILPINKLLVSDLNQSVREVMSTDTTVISVHMDEKNVANLFERNDLISAPVTNNQGILLGRITIDDVVDVIRDTADHSLMSMAGLDEEEDTFSPTIKTSKRRAVWLGINLLTAFIASAVISLFDVTIEKVVALAVLMPIVASMGGIAGSQVLTLVIRGQALGHLSENNIKWLLKREMTIGVLNGILWSVVIGSVTWFWFSDALLAAIIGSAIIINLFVAAISGATLPLILTRLKIDPALAGSVILTTITDVVGFFSFLGLASYFYIT
jgi:magnesium transporter